ncbi:hypothetical protein AWB94_31270 [Mycolicibacterium canariasense]|nr:hypothetical protein AWB94_31270 [Mycolicibacterium canariasense]
MVVKVGVVPPGHLIVGHVTVLDPVASCANANVNDLPAAAVGNVSVQFAVNVIWDIVAPVAGSGMVCAEPEVPTVFTVSTRGCFVESATVMSAVPLKATPLIFRAVASCVAVAALPVVDWFKVGKVQFARFPLAGVPKAGVTKVGEVAREELSIPVDRGVSGDLRFG